AGRFELKLDDGTKIPAKFSPKQEAVIIEALQNHSSRRLRVKGLAEFSPEGKVQTITEISGLTVQPVGELDFNAEARPIWEVIAELGKAVPVEEWAKVPEDAAANLDHYLYGHPKSTK